MTTALITGVCGQDGSYLADFLVPRGYSVFGLERPESSGQKMRPGVTPISGDMTNAASVAEVIRACEPDEVYNFAAQSSVAASGELADETQAINADGVLNLITALRTHAPNARFFQASSSEIFGAVTEAPQNETTPLRPRNPYGYSKAVAHAATAAAREDGLHASAGIFFNHESPRRGSGFVTTKIANAAAAISRTGSGAVELGRMEARRDWGWAPDYVEAAWMMLQHDTPGNFVIGTGETHSVDQFCAAAFSHVGLNHHDHVRVNPDFVRPPETVDMVSDPRLINETLGWSATKPFDEIVAAMVDAALERLDG